MLPYVERGCLCVIINRLRILLEYREDRGVGTGTEGLKSPRAGRVKTECQKRFVSLKIEA